MRNKHQIIVIDYDCDLSASTKSRSVSNTSINVAKYLLASKNENVLTYSIFNTISPVHQLFRKTHAETSSQTLIYD